MDKLRLLVAFNKAGIHVSEKEYQEEWDIPMTNSAIEMMPWTQDEIDKIFQYDYDAFEVH